MAKERSKLMDKNRSSVVDRAVIRGAAEMVGKCRRSGGRLAGFVRRSSVINNAVLEVEHEIRKDPEKFARYIVSRMCWDMLGDVSVYMA